MAIKLKFQASTGKAAIYDDDNEAAFTDPLNNLGDVFFHSDLDYLTVVEHVVIPFTLPARNSGSEAWWLGGNDKLRWGFVHHPLHTAIQTFDIVLGRIDKLPLTGTNFVYKNNDSFRSIALSWSGQNIELFETSLVKGSIPEQQITVHLFLIKQQQADPLKDKVKMNGETDLIEFGQGKFSNRRKHIRKAISATPEFFLFNDGKSLDLKNCGIRALAVDGSYTDFNGYTGIWTASNKYGVVT